jgi:hypothetical protein
MQRSLGVVRERKLLLAVVAVASGVTISCSDPGAIGVFNRGWDAAFEDAANPLKPTDAAADAGDAAETSSDASDAARD